LLLDVLDGNKATQRELIDLAKERSGSTKDSRLEIEQAEKFLAIQGRTPEQIRKTILAAQDLAVVTGQTLEKAVEDLDVTMVGWLAKGLQKLSSQFKDLSKEPLYHGAAIDIVAKKYNGLAEEEMKTTEGRLVMLGKGWKALQRTIGEAMLRPNGMFDGLIEGATKGLNVMKKWFEMPLTAKIKEEQEALNMLVFQIQATNTNQKERNRLIDELRQKYPAFLGNLKDEDVSNQFLAKQLQEVNYQYMVKIRLAKSEESLKDIAEQQQKASDNVRQLKKEMKAGQEEFYAEYVRIAKQAVNSSLNLSNTLDAVSNQILSITLQSKDKTLQLIIQAAIEDCARQKRMMEKRKTSYQEDLNWHKMSIDQLNDYISKGREADATNTDRTNMRKAQDELNSRVKAGDKIRDVYKDLVNSLKDIEGKNYADKFTQSQQEIRLVEEKYNTLIQKGLKFKTENEKTLSSQHKP
jgi:hypothetical protein